MLDEDVTTELDAVLVGDGLVATPVIREERRRVDAFAATVAGVPSPVADRTVRAEDPQGADRRCAPRVALQADVSLFSATTFWAGLTEDLSEGGLFVATYQLERLGTSMDLRFELPTGHAVKVEGVVRWIREGSEHAAPGMGIAFKNLSPQDHAVIKSFVKHRPPLLWDVD